jgi:hypothetical protein
MNKKGKVVKKLRRKKAEKLKAKIRAGKAAAKSTRKKA